MLNHGILCFVMLYYVKLSYVMVPYAMWYYVVLYYNTVLNYAIHHIIPYDDILYSVIRQKA